MSEEPRAIAIETAAAEWLEKRTHGEWSAEDQEAFEAWMSQSLAHRVAFLRLEEAWRFADRLSALRKVRVSAAQKLRRRIAAGALAACFGIAAGVYGMQFYSFAPREQTYVTGIGESKRLRLNDGSVVELNTDTKVRIAREGETRKVWLDKGEAFFHVQHDPERPFVVLASGHRILDIGTKFLVRRDREKLQVSVLEGKVEYDPDPKAPVKTLLLPGDVLTAAKGSVSINRAGATEIANALGWRSGVITLDNTTLADAAAEFNRYSRRRIVIGDSSVAGLRIMGTFQAGNADAFVAVAQDIFKLRVKRGKDEIVLSR